MMHINGETKIVGILGYPVTHSLSPLIHNAAFAALKLNWAYIPLPVNPEKINDVRKGLRTFNFAGANVTVPHKQAVMRQLDEIDPVAREIGAVNTIAVQNGALRGFNTDADGFLQALLEKGFEPKGARCLVLGAGGAARATVFSLAHAGAKRIAVFNRTVERAAFLVDDLRATFETVQFSCESLTPHSLDAANDSFDLVVNTTSLGMFPHVDTSPWHPDIPLPNATICDLVYTPIRTKFLQQAESQNLPAIDGTGMLIHQGARAFEIWTGHPAPVDVLRQTLLAALA